MKTTHKLFNTFAIGALVLSLNSCQEILTKEEHDSALTEVLEFEDLKRDSLERVYIATLDEIDGNIDAVREKYEGISMVRNSPEELMIPKKDKIVGDIHTINGLLENNKTKIAALEKSLAGYKSGKQELINSIKKAKEKVEAQQKQMDAFKILLAEKDYKIEELNGVISARDFEIAQLALTNKEKDSKLNTTYFAFGTYKQLKEKHIVRKEAGILGIGKAKLLDENLDKRNFTEMDKTATTTISVQGKNPQLISKHPANTYTIKTTSNDLATLTISDPDNFWKMSKYLVIEVH